MILDYPVLGIAGKAGHSAIGGRQKSSPGCNRVVSLEGLTSQMDDAASPAAGLGCARVMPQRCLDAQRS
jgi:hypothetical protein